MKHVRKWLAVFCWIIAIVCIVWLAGALLAGLGSGFWASTGSAILSTQTWAFGLIGLTGLSTFQLGLSSAAIALVALALGYCAAPAEMSQVRDKITHSIEQAVNGLGRVASSVIPWWVWVLGAGYLLLRLSGGNDEPVRVTITSRGDANA